VDVVTSVAAVTFNNAGLWSRVALTRYALSGVCRDRTEARQTMLQGLLLCRRFRS